MTAELTSSPDRNLDPPPDRQPDRQPDRTPDRIGLPVGFVTSPNKLAPPPRRSALVTRRRLVEQLTGVGDGVALLAAPAGYGKSTLLGQLVDHDRRPTAWLSLEAADNDPVVLITNLVQALSPIEAVDAAVLTALWRPDPRPTTVVLPRLGRSLTRRRTPFLLVLDDVHQLVAPEALDVLAVVVAEAPPGTTLVLSGRTLPPLPYERLRSRRAVRRFGRTDLAFTPTEAAALFDELGVALPVGGLEQLLEATEGWAAALYLASLSLHDEPDPARAVAAFAGDDRLVAEYIRDELLDALDPEVAAFLLEVSCLAELTGARCDEVLERRGSAELLARLAEDNWLVLPLDGEAAAYRLHHLFAELLEAELGRRDPGRQRALHDRASRRSEAEGDLDAAVHHAVRSGELDRAERLIAASFPSYATVGRHATLVRWLGLLGPEEQARRPMLAIMAGYTRLAGGDGAGAAHWCARAAATVADHDPAPGPGWTPPVAVAILRATIGFGPVREMLADVDYALTHIGPDEQWLTMCDLLVGAAAFMAGDEARAARHLEQGATRDAATPNVTALCLAHEAVLHVEAGRWDRATALARRARDELRAHALDDIPNLFLVSAMSSLVEARAGRLADARADHGRSLRNLTGYLHQAGWANFQARIALARASILLGDRAAARTLLDEVQHGLRRVPDAPRVVAQLVAVRRELRESTTTAAGPPAAALSPGRTSAAPGSPPAGTRPTGSSGHGTLRGGSLTTAELRVLQHLPSHLSLVEIADRLFVSRNTVKSQTVAIYRKLGVRSRSGAVEVAGRGGLLDDVLAGS